MDVRAAVGRLLTGSPAPVRSSPPPPPLTPEPAIHWVRTKTSSIPLLSVIVPAYNVEAYIDETLASILQQTYRNLEIVLVNDGSTDSTGLICDAHASRDARIRVIHQTNAGLSQARNVGIEVATGEFLCFSDSDDIVPTTAYEHMVSTLLRSGSDFVSGNVRRFDEARSWNAWNQSSSHTRTITRTTLAKRPDLIFDLVCWNKVYRRAFIDRIDLRFPVGRLYEDMEPMALAYTQATSVDVLARTVYHWRRRDTRDSITQQRHDVDNLQQKIEQIDRAFAELEKHANSTALDHLCTKALQGDLYVYVEELAAADQTFRETFTEAALRYWARTPAEVRMRLPDRYRTFYAVLDRYDLNAAVSTDTWFGENVHDIPTRLRRDAVHIDTRQSNLPVSLPRLARNLISGTKVVAHVDAMWWRESHLVLQGWAYIPHVDEASEQKMSLQARHVSTGVTIRMRVQATPSPGAARHSRTTTRDHTASGFIAELDTRHAIPNVRFTTGHWEFIVNVETGKVSRSSTITLFDRTGSLRAMSPRALGNGLELVSHTNARQPLGFSVRRPAMIAQAVQISGRRVSVVVTHPPNLTIAATVLDHMHPHELVAGVVEHHDNSTTLHFDLPQARSRANITRRVKVTLDDGRVRNVSPGELSPEPLPTESLSVGICRAGWLDIHDFTKSATVETFEPLDDFRFRLTGSVPTPVALEVSIHRANAKASTWQSARVIDGRFDVVVDLGYRDWYGTRRPQPLGTYAVSLRSTMGDFSDDSWQLRCAHALLKSFPQRSDGPMACITAKATGEGLLQFQIAVPQQHDGGGPFEVRRLREEFGADVHITPERAVFLVCDIGSNANSHPLAIFNELSSRGAGFRFYWGVTDFSVPVPPGATAVVKFSREWYSALARSSHVVIDYGGVDGLVPRSHQRVLQTWHGTPYKFIGRAQIKHQRMPDAESQRRRSEGSGWNLMLSTSPFYSELVPNELDYTGALAEVGSPRNDALVKIDDDHRQQLRTQLGVPLGKKVLLYTPTFRDQLRSDWVAAPYRGLNLERLARVLGEEWVVVARGHSFNARHGGRFSSASSQVFDATDHFDINHLYLISDVLVTDYSSAMFDYCLTGRPILFFTPDHETYLTHRGAYFDLAEAAPGPMCSTEEDLFIALGSIDEFDDTYGERYAQFQERFVPWDDGHASARLVDQFFDVPPARR